jgi:hypothetical protein
MEDIPKDGQAIGLCWSKQNKYKERSRKDKLKLYEQQDISDERLLSHERFQHDMQM